MSSARAKTMEHLRELVTAVAVVSALSAEASACGGYGVVDPLPPPTRCPDALKSLTAKVTTVGADVRVEISIDPKSGQSFSLESATIVSGGKLVSSNYDGATLVVVVTPDPGASVRFKIKSDCTPDGSITATVAPSGAADAGTYGVTFEAP